MCIILCLNLIENYYLSFRSISSWRGRSIWYWSVKRCRKLWNFIFSQKFCNQKLKNSAMHPNVCVCCAKKLQEPKKEDWSQKTKFCKWCKSQKVCNIASFCNIIATKKINLTNRRLKFKEKVFSCETFLIQPSEKGR